MLTSGIIGIAFIAALVLFLGVTTGPSRRRRPASNADGTAYMGNGGAECDSGSDGGCDGGGGDGGGGGGD